MKVSVIGFGNMGSAIVRSWIKNKTFNPSDISLFDADQSKLRNYVKAEIKKDNFAELIDISQNKEAIKNADFILLAVKPQDLSSIKEQYPVPENATIISILAGISIAKLGDQLGRHTLLVRTMPNLAATVGHSITGYVVSSDTTEDHLKQVEKLLTAFGTAYKIESEDMMDAWCALAGSGPGMVFYLMNKFNTAAKELGFSADMSQQITSQVFLGSSILAAKYITDNSSEVFSELVSSVCSKGGTTEKAISVFEQSGVMSILKEAILSAEARSKQLNSL